MNATPTEARRRTVLAKLRAVSAEIQGILNGQDITLADVKLPQEGDPGETHLERLRRFKKLLNDCLGELVRGDPRVCRGCDAPLPDLELDAMPWAWRCRACGSED